MLHNLAPKWKVSLEDFQMYLVASGITDNKKKRALLLNQAGPRVREIFRQIPDNGDDDDFDTAVAKLNAYFEPQKHRLCDVYQFRQAKQGNTETLDQYYTRQRSLSPRCEFARITPLCQSVSLKWPKSTRCHTRSTTRSKQYTANKHF